MMTDLKSFQIIRDKQYESVYRRDMRRQKLRRWVHQLASVFESRFNYSRWRESPHHSDGDAPSLSTCIITMNSAHRIRPLLSYIRSFSDEIVVGIDSKTTDDTYEQCKGLVDELFVIENTSLTCNAGLEELVSRCQGQWVLRLDDDEFPEPHFAQIKNGLITQQQVTHYKLPRLHLSKVDPVTQKLWWINDGYLYPDYQMRLFKNDPTLLSFPGAVGHSSIHCDGPRGKVHSVNLVHLNLAMNPRFKREEKLKKYIERLNGQWVHPINEHALLFEDFQYRIEPYQYPDEGFRQLLTSTINQQRHAFEIKQQQSTANC